MNQSIVSSCSRGCVLMAPMSPEAACDELCDSASCVTPLSTHHVLQDA